MKSNWKLWTNLAVSADPLSPPTVENLQKHWVSNNKLIKVFWLPDSQGCLFSHLTEYCSLAVLGNIMGNLQTTHEFQSIHVILMPQNIQKPQHLWHGPPSLESSPWSNKDDIITLWPSDITTLSPSVWSPVKVCQLLQKNMILDEKRTPGTCTDAV